MTPPPPATFNGKPIPNADRVRYGTYAAASTVFELVMAAIVALPGVMILTPARLFENSAGDDFILTTPIPAGGPVASTIGDWWITCVFLVGSPGEPNAVVYSLSEWACQLAERETNPDMAFGDTNYQEVGHGADTIDAPVPGKIAIELLADTGTAECHWVAA
jgi:hypothetical protein